MANKYTYKVLEVAAVPRTGRALDGVPVSRGTQGGYGGSSFTGYWSLISTDSDGNPLEDNQQYIKTKYTAVSEGDVVAYSTSDHEVVLPHAGYEMVGAVQIKPDSGLIIDSATGLLSVDPTWKGGGESGGVNFTPGSGLQLSADKILSVKYGVAADTVAAGNDFRILNGQKAYEVITKGTWWGQKMTEAGVVTGALAGVTNINGKLSFIDTGVDVTGNVRATGDVVAYATSDGDISDWLGLVIDNETIRFNETGKLYAAGGGGQAGIAGITVTGSGNAVTAVALSADNTSLTFTKGSTFALKSEIPIIPSAIKNPYSLTWSGYDSGTYDGSSSKNIPIPSNTSQLTNGAGFIKDGNGNFTSLSGSGSSSKYLAGNGTFYTIGYSELSGTPDLSVYVRKAGDTMSGNLTISKSVPTLLLSGSRTWQIYESGGDLGFKNNGVLSAYFSGANNGNFTINGNLLAQGNVVAYSSGNWDITSPVAGTNVLGMIKVGSGLSISNGVLSVVGGGGGAVSVIDNLTSTSTTSALSANQGRLLDSRLQSVKFGTNYTDYVVTQLGSTSYNLSKNGHTHAWSEITSKPSWIGSSKPSYSWSEITSKPTVLSSISYSTVGSGNVVTNVTASGSIVTVTKGNVSSGSSFNGGTITSNLTISRSDPGIALTGSSPFVKWGSSWQISIYNSDLRVMYGGTSRAYWSYASSGNMWIAGSLVQNSDMRKKTMKSYLLNALNGIRTLDVFRYTYNNDTTGLIRIGMSAQQVRAHFPEFVFMEPDGFYSMDYGSMSSLAIQGVKELLSIVESQRKEIDSLKEQLNKMAA
ncbi:tail fiber domain-containing protein [Parabacteroides sp.]